MILLLKLNLSIVVLILTVDRSLYYCMQMILSFWLQTKARCKNSLMLFIIGVVNGAWKLTLKIKKQKLYTSDQKVPPLTKSTFFYGNCEFKIVQCYKYLGTYIDENLSFAEHSDAIAAAGSRALGRIRHKLYYLKECRSATFTKLYSSCICPILDYCAAIWGDKEFIKIEQVQIKATMLVKFMTIRNMIVFFSHFVRFQYIVSGLIHFWYCDFPSVSIFRKLVSYPVQGTHWWLLIFHQRLSVLLTVSIDQNDITLKHSPKINKRACPNKLHFGCQK